MTSNQSPAFGSYITSNGTASTNPYVEHFDTRAPTSFDVNYPIQKKWFNKTNNVEYILVGFTSSEGILQADWRFTPTSLAMDSFMVDNANLPGVNPVVPDTDGLLTITGAQVTNMGWDNVIKTITNNVNQYTITIQQSGSSPTADITKNGVCHFNSADFDIDPATGFVSVSGATIGETITGNSGGSLAPTAGNWNIITANTTVKMAGSGSTLTEDFGLTNLILGSSATGITSGNLNVGVGLNSLNSTTSGSGNVAIGASSLSIISTGGNNTAVGYFSGNLIVSGSNSTLIGSGSGSRMTTGLNTFIGANSGALITTGSLNTCVGNGSYNLGVTGVRIIAIGDGSANNYTSSESSNIIIGNNGTAGESNVIRIGTQGALTGQQNTCFIAGIVGVTTSNTSIVSIDTTTGQMGVLTYTTGGSFTPVLAFGGASVGITYASRTGVYTRVGNVVTFTIDLQLSNKGSSTGAATITGLPFAASANTIFAISASSLTFSGMVNARAPGNAIISIDQWATTGARTTLSDTAFVNGTFVQISGSYLA